MMAVLFWLVWELYSPQTVLITLCFCLESTISQAMSLDCGESYHESNSSSPSFAMAATIVMTFHASGFVEVYQEAT
jgi:hypothetical protein